MESVFSQLTTILGGIVLPILAVVLTWALRGRSFVQTSWADLLLALLLFDFALAMSSGTASALVPSEELRPHSTAIFVVLGIGALLAMIISIQYLEKQLANWHLSRDLREMRSSGVVQFAGNSAHTTTNFPFVRMIVVTTIFMVVLGLHFVVLAYR